MCRSSKRPAFLLNAAGSLRLVHFSSIPGMLRVGQAKVLSAEGMAGLQPLSVQNSEFGWLKHGEGTCTLRGFTISGTFLNPKCKAEFKDTFTHMEEVAGLLYLLSGQRIHVLDAGLAEIRVLDFGKPLRGFTCMGSQLLCWDPRSLLLEGKSLELPRSHCSIVAAESGPGDLTLVGFGEQEAMTIYKLNGGQLRVL